MNDMEQFKATHGKLVRLRGSQGGTPTFVAANGDSVTCGSGMNTYLSPTEPIRRLKYQRSYYEELLQTAEVDVRDLELALKDSRVKPWQHPQPDDWRFQHYGSPTVIRSRVGYVCDGRATLEKLRSIIADCNQHLELIELQLAKLRPSGAFGEPVEAVTSVGM